MMVEIIQKAWGTTQKLFSTKTIEIWLARIDKGGFCSEHSHHARNSLHVISGKLIIVTYRDGGVLTFLLHCGDSFLANSGEVHRFEAPEDAIVLETYCDDELELDDIRRFTESGKRISA